jgi:hypothetical protein
MKISEDVANKLIWLNDFTLYNAPPHFIKVKAAHVINFFKAGMLAFCLIAMIIYQNFTSQAALYTGLHGSYGLLWILKDRIFPDPGFERQVSLGSVGSILSVVTIYASYPFILMAKYIY